MNRPIPFILGLVVLSLCIITQLMSFLPDQTTFHHLEHLAYDLQIRASLPKHHSLKSSQIAIVDIDDKSLKQEGRWPWSRLKLASLVKELKTAGAAVIAFDILFSEDEKNVTETIKNKLKNESLLTDEMNKLLLKIKTDFDYDNLFAKQFDNIDAVFGITFIFKNEKLGPYPKPLTTLTTSTEKNLNFITAAGYITNIPILQKTGKENGFMNVFPDSDGIIRRVPLLMRYQDGVYPSLALQTASLYLLRKPRIVTAQYHKKMQIEGVALGDYIIPTDNKSQVIIPFIGKSYTFPYFSATDIINKKIPAKYIKGKIIFIGTSAAGLGELRATTVEEVYPGVEIHASITQGILNHTFTYQPPWVKSVELIFTIVIGLFCVFIFPFLGPLILTIMIISLPILCIIINHWIQTKTGLVIPILIPTILPCLLAITNIIYGYVSESNRRQKLKEIFDQYVPEKHIDEMLSEKKIYNLKGEDREMTVLFADIRSFSNLSEDLPAEQVTELLNKFFTPMTEIIFKHNGTIDKYIGDSIMAFWGAPLKDFQNAKHALQAALDMQKNAKILREAFVQQKLPEINIGIGINTGLMRVGDMGSLFRKNYTVIGDAVNLGSRAESLSKYYGVLIVATEYTIKDQDDFIVRQLDRVKVHGKKNGVALYEILCRKAEVTDELAKELQQWQEGLDYYFAQKWLQAENIFKLLIEKFPEKKLYSIYWERTLQFMQNPPPPSWNGIFEHLNK